jgi:hypothetical protein
MRGDSTPRDFSTVNPVTGRCEEIDLAEISRFLI